MKKLPFEVHPAANIFPMIKGAAFKELVDDIRENGINEPVVFWNGKLLDGRNRSMACIEIGIDPLDHAIDINPETDPVAFVLSANLHRRHLGETERETIAAKIANLEHGDVKTQKSDPTIVGSKSTAEAAEQLNVNPRNVERAKAAIKGGCKELVALLEAGEIPSSTASKFVKAVPGKKEQAKILEGGLAAVRQAIKESKQSQSRPSIKAASEDSMEQPQAESENPKAKPKSSERQFFNDLRKLFDEMDDFHKQRSLELWSEWLLTKDTK
jgi:ParB-like chromosome segregation protein Spo0J